MLRAVLLLRWLRRMLMLHMLLLIGVACCAYSLAAAAAAVTMLRHLQICAGQDGGNKTLSRVLCASSRIALEFGGLKSQDIELCRPWPGRVKLMPGRARQGSTCRAVASQTVTWSPSLFIAHTPHKCMLYLMSIV